MLKDQKQPWEMTRDEFFESREVIVKGSRKGEKISRFPGGYESGIFPEIGYKRPDGSVFAFGRRLTASQWDKDGIPIADLKEVARRIYEEVIQQAVKKNKPVPVKILKDVTMVRRFSGEYTGDVKLGLLQR